ncbi:acetyltransferase [Algoriphagus aestuarii]|nr:acetyltransferase [Algoriphagus aestuarii]
MIIAGAGGHSLEVLDSIKSFSFEVKPVFFSEFKEGNNQLTSVYKLIHTQEEIKYYFTKDCKFFLGVGNPSLRKRFLESLERIGGEYQSIRDKTSSVSSSAKGAFDAMAFTFVGPETHLEKGVLINTRASIHHGTRIGEYSEIGPGAILLGNVRIGKKCKIGAGAVILPGVVLGNEVVVGAGAVVISNVPDAEVIAGVPAKSIKK